MNEKYITIKSFRSYLLFLWDGKIYECRHAYPVDEKKLQELIKEKARIARTAEEQLKNMKQYETESRFYHDYMNLNLGPKITY